MDNPNIWANSGVNSLNLVRFLIGTHHGWGRPFWPVVRDDEKQTVTHTLCRRRPFWPDVPVTRDPAARVRFDLLSLSSSASPGFERIDSCWPELFWSMVRDYGPWGLALLESILILADHEARARSRRTSHEPNTRG